MRILFLGTSPFAVPSLNLLSQNENHTLLGVVTQPDRPHGRGGKQLESPVKSAALSLGLPIYQPEKVRDREFRTFVCDLAPDALVVAAFGQLISGRMLEIPKYGGINVHGSLLPRWRGAAPMQYSLIEGDSETGVTTMQMDVGLDTGDILLQSSLPLDTVADLADLEQKLSILGADLLIKTLEALERGDCARIPQDPNLATYAPSLPSDFGEVDWKHSAVGIYNLVRGVTPRPGAYTLWQDKRLKLWETRPLDDAHAQDGVAGVIQNIDRQGITVSTGSGALLLVSVQPESKGRMNAADWARGARITTGSAFTHSRDID
jgi:methionyl-tRNA formyltransferase